MIEQTELTRGQKIDEGDKILARIAVDREVTDRVFEQVVKDLKIGFAQRALRLIELGGFPEENSVLNEDSEMEELMPLLMVDSKWLEVYGDSGAFLALTSDGILKTGVYQGAWIVNRESLVEVDPYYYIVNIREIYKSFEGAIQQAQERWFNGERKTDVSADEGTKWVPVDLEVHKGVGFH